MAMPQDHNLLVISDLHLGEELRLEVHNAAAFAEISEGLATFLAHYAEHREHDLPWQLVINGDMIDFLSVYLMPYQVRKVAGLPEADHIWGLGTHPEAAVHKLRLVTREHEAVFDALARFIAAGNRVAIVVGNHDREFYWELVQRALQDDLGERIAAKGAADITLDDVLSFHVWFFYLPSVAWIEHGDQYDSYCSQDLVLDPRSLHDAKSLEYNVGEAAMRYIANRLPDAPETQQNQGFFQYLKLPFERTERAAWIFAGYAELNLRMLAQWLSRVTHARRHVERIAAHQAAMNQLALAQDLDIAVLDELNRARVAPLYADLDALITSMMLGRFLLFVGTLIMVPLILLTMTWPMAPMAAGVGTVAAALLSGLLAARRPDIDPQPDMLAAAAHIRELVDVPLVVFGHSHAPLAKRLSRNGWYFNTGTWVGGRDHVRSFTHLVVKLSADDQHAALCQWREGKSWELRAETTPRRFRPGWAGGVFEPRR